MPRVGSCSISTRGLVTRLRPRMIFCWLPPDSVPSFWPSRAMRASRRATWARASRLMAPRLRKPAIGEARQGSRHDVFGDVIASRPPAPRRSAGTNDIPSRIAARGSNAAGPRRRSRPGRPGRKDRTTPRRDRPCRNPAGRRRPRISPARTSKLTPSRPGAVRSSPSARRRRLASSPPGRATTAGRWPGRDRPSRGSGALPEDCRCRAFRWCGRRA